MQTLEEYVNANSILTGSLITLIKKLTHPKEYIKAVEVLKDVLKRKSKKKSFNHDLYYYASQVAQSFANVETKELVKAYVDSEQDLYGFKV